MVVVSWGPPQMPNGISLEYSVELERYEDGSEFDRQEVDGNTFVVEFDDSQNIGKFNVTVVIFLLETCIKWTEGLFVLRSVFQLKWYQLKILVVMHMYMCWSLNLSKLNYYLI